MLKKALEVFLLTVIVFGVAGAYFKFVGGIPFSVSQVSTTKNSTFDVSGVGKSSIAPDEAVIDLGIRKQGKTVKEAQKLGNEALNNLVEAVGKLGVEKKDIKTVNYSVSPEYDPTNYRKVTGFVVYANIEVKIGESNFEKLEQVMDSAGELGLEQVGSLRFQLSESVAKKAKEGARALAVKEAKEKADSLAKLAGVNLGRIVNVSETETGVQMPVFGRSIKSDINMVAQSTEVNPGTSDVSVSVTLSFETL